MKFEFIKKVDGEVMSLGRMVKTGDVVDLPPHLAKKALKRPNDYRKVETTEVSEGQAVGELKPRRGRRPKVKVGDES
jgi:hypothetical protein